MWTEPWAQHDPPSSTLGQHEHQPPRPPPTRPHCRRRFLPCRQSTVRDHCFRGQTDIGILCEVTLAGAPLAAGTLSGSPVRRQGSPWFAAARMGWCGTAQSQEVVLAEGPEGEGALALGRHARDGFSMLAVCCCLTSRFLCGVAGSRSGGHRLCPGLRAVAWWSRMDVHQCCGRCGVSPLPASCYIV